MSENETSTAQLRDLNTPSIPTASANERVPVTVLTGFLGSGKTTLVNYILTAEHGMRIAVIENEFGDIPIDNALVIGGDEKIIEMSNGCCLCCAARTDLIDILNSLAEREGEFDMVLIETSGMAEPNPVAQTFFVDENVAEYFALDAIVTLVDAKHVGQHLDETQVDGVGNHTSNQIAFADRVVINKVDLVATEELAHVQRRVRAINATADILTSHYGEVDLRQILGISAFNRTGSSSDLTDWLAVDGHGHDETLSSESIEVEGAIDLEAFRSWVEEYVAAHGQALYRLKGILRVADAQRPYFIQGVHQLFDISPAQGNDPLPERSIVVFIGRDLDRSMLSEGLRGCVRQPVVVAG